jgi:hypothetical protein
MKVLSAEKSDLSGKKFWEHFDVCGLKAIGCSTIGKWKRSNARIV